MNDFRLIVTRIDGGEDLIIEDTVSGVCRILKADNPRAVTLLAALEEVQP